MSLRALIVKCDFNAKFTLQDMPGLLQILKQKEGDLLIRRGQGCDYLPSGGYTPYGAELLRSDRFLQLLEQGKKEYDFVFLVFRSPIHSAESLVPLSFAIARSLPFPASQRSS